MAKSTHKSVKKLPPVAQARFRPVYILLLLAICISLLRLHTYNEPTDRDLATYAVLGHEMLAGRNLYSGTMVDQKPPAIHVTYAVAELLVGYGRQQIYLLGIGAAIASMLGAYFGAKWLTGSARVGLWTAAFWAVACHTPRLEANQPNSEVFINAAAIVGLAFFLRPSTGKSATRDRLISGGFFALASLYKHTFAVIPIAICVCNLVLPLAGRNRKSALIDTALIGIVGLLAWTGVTGYFGATGRFHDFYTCMVTYNLHYAGSGQSNFLSGFEWRRVFPPILNCLIPLFMLSGFGIISGFRRKKSALSVLLIVLAVATQIAIAIPGKFYPHYYQLWYPFLLLGCASGLDGLRMFSPKDSESAQLLNSLAMTAVVILIAIHGTYFFDSAEQWSLGKGDNIFVITTRLAAPINQMLKKDESFFQLGSEAQLYFDTKRRPPSIIGDYLILSGPLAEDLSKLTVQELAKNPPDLLLAEKWTIAQISPSNPVVQWIQANYTQPPFGAFQDPFYLFTKRGSDLESRWRTATPGGPTIPFK